MIFAAGATQKLRSILPNASNNLNINDEKKKISNFICIYNIAHCRLLYSGFNFIMNLKTTTFGGGNV